MTQLSTKTVDSFAPRVKLEIYSVAGGNARTSLLSHLVVVARLRTGGWPMRTVTAIETLRSSTVTTCDRRWRNYRFDDAGCIPAKPM